MTLPSDYVFVACRDYAPTRVLATAELAAEWLTARAKRGSYEVVTLNSNHVAVGKRIPPGKVTEHLSGCRIVHAEGMDGHQLAIKPMRVWTE